MIQNRYLVVHQIGKGGMGEVYLAVDQRLGSAVAIKRMTLIGDDVMAAAFEREAKVLGRLRHPVLPKVIDHFVDSNGQFLVMEHISGDDLAKRLESAGKPFPLSWVMFWSDQLLDCLTYLHSHEPPIIHRDIKPQNLKLTDENHIVLLDFGLSKDFDTGKGDSPVNSASVSGYSPAFAPMEQIRGSGTDARSDIYSFAASFYQLLANAIPTDVLARADALLGGAPDPVVPLHIANPQVTQSVSAVFMKALSVRQDERYATAAEMQRELRRAFNAAGGQSGAETLVMASPGAEPSTAKPSTTTQGNENVDNPTLVMGSGQPAVVTDLGPRTDEASADLGATIVMEENIGTEPFLQNDIATQVIPAAPSAPVPGPPVVQSPPAADIQKTVPAASQQDNVPEPSRVVVSTGSDAPNTSAATASASLRAATSAPAAQPSAKSKKGGAKTLVLVVAGLFGLLLIVAGGAGGFYLYTQYSGASPAVEASPTPTPAPATAANTAPRETEQIPETGANSPVNTSDSGVALSNTDPGGTKPAANKASTGTGGVNPRPTPQQRGVADKESKPATPKPTPKPRSGDDRTVIMQ
jgi:serine/threonine protein kinase